jgi:phage-related minor tail protein
MQENMQNLTKQGLDGLTDSLAAGITGAADFADAMKAMAKSVVDSLIKMLIQKYIVDAAFGFITSSFGTGGTGSTGSGATSGGGLGMGQGYSNTAAIGGPVFQGERTLVGERGPEIFVPNANGSIIPNHKLGGDGVTINQTINVTTGVQQTVRAEIATLMPQIASAAKGAVADARQRGGGFSKALVGA